MLLNLAPVGECPDSFLLEKQLSFGYAMVMVCGAVVGIISRSTHGNSIGCTEYLSFKELMNASHIWVGKSGVIPGHKTLLLGGSE